MHVSRAILVLGAEWACLAAGLVAGMAAERWAASLDVRIVLSCVAALALAAGIAAGRFGLADAHERRVGSLMFALSAAVVNLMMVRDGTDAHLAGGVLCAAAAGGVFHLTAAVAGKARPGALPLDPAKGQALWKPLLK